MVYNVHGTYAIDFSLLMFSAVCLLVLRCSATFKLQLWMVFLSRDFKIMDSSKESEDVNKFYLSVNKILEFTIV